MPDTTPQTAKKQSNIVGMLPAIGNAAGSIIGLLTQKQQDRRQLEQQQKLNDMQIKANKKMSIFNQQQQQANWENTSFSAQMQQLAKAGLNPALLYGQGGNGGQAFSSAEGVAAQSAPKGTGQEVQQFMAIMAQTAAQTALLKAQKENVDADTANKTANTGVQGATQANIEANTGVQNQNILNIAQDTKNKTAQERLTNISADIADIQRTIADATQLNNILTNDINTQRAQAELQLLWNQVDISDATKETTIKQIRQDLTNSVIDSWLKKNQITLNAQQTQRLKDQTNIDMINAGQNALRNQIDATFKSSVGDAAEAQGKLTNKRTQYYELEMGLNAVSKFLKPFTLGK